jgi:hypothetical protein
MSELPQLDPQQVSHRISMQLAFKIHEVVKLELLAEMLRDERDAAREALARALNTTQTTD